MSTKAPTRRESPGGRDYGYANARLRGMRSHLLKKPFLDELMRRGVIEGPSGRRLRTKAERARIAAESLVPGASVTDVAQRHGTTRWQIYD